MNARFSAEVDEDEEEFQAAFSAAPILGVLTSSPRTRHISPVPGDSATDQLDSEFVGTIQYEATRGHFPPRLDPRPAAFPPELAALEELAQIAPWCVIRRRLLKRLRSGGPENATYFA